MDAFATEAQKYAAANPKIAALKGYAFYDAGDVQEINHDYTAALALLNKALAYGEVPFFLKDRARAYDNLKMPDAALRDINRAIELDPADAEAYSIRCIMLGNQNRMREALRDLNTADELDPNNADYMKQRNWISGRLVYSGFELQKNGDFAGEMKDYDLAVQADPGNASVYYWRARGYLAEKKPDPAYNDLEKAMALNPGYFDAYLLLDRGILTARSDWDGIIASWNKYIALHPEDGRAYVEQGGAYFHKGDLVSAVKDAKRGADRGDANGRMIYERFKNQVKLN